ncbi:hypothetical protein [Kribbella sindirgiensis]|uniref:Uncharacterized protein n=1 Tax=Kribbella sindirgiensis TaxID=1124744 RepID=A0A4R0I3Q4_9ACTN|nr:hypothetical protein [Kribbella sindirgiensis]TCC21651.1 hypothetical protein E0H50_35845 [Kribbella sindirgiensis]
MNIAEPEELSEPHSSLRPALTYDHVDQKINVEVDPNLNPEALEPVIEWTGARPSVRYQLRRPPDDQVDLGHADQQAAGNQGVGSLHGAENHQQVKEVTIRCGDEPTPDRVSWARQVVELEDEMSRLVDMYSHVQGLSSNLTRSSGTSSSAS